MTRSLTLVAPAFVAALGASAPSAARGSQAPAPAAAAAPAPASVTVPFVLDHNRMTIEVDVVRPDGTLRRAAAWVDLGSPQVVVGELLARDLGLAPEVIERATGEDLAAAPPCLPLRVAGLGLDVTGVKLLVRPGANWRPGVAAEMLLPASALLSGQVVLDYPARRMTIARAGAPRHRGVGVPCRVNAQTGLLQIDATVDGRAVALGIDNGSAGTWVSTSLTDAWRQRHPAWRHAIGAAGSANFWGIRLETGGTLMLLPEIGIGSTTTRDVAVLGVAQGLFDWYARKSAGPVAGFLGANVLRRYRIAIDYPNRMTYWEGGAAVGPRDLDIVGLTVRAEADGGYTVAGVVTRDGTPAVDGVEVGDALLRVGALDATGARMGDVIAALRGAPGEARTLLLARGGERVTVKAVISHLP